MWSRELTGESNKPGLDPRSHTFLFCFNLDKVSDFRLQVYKMGWTDSVFDSDIVMATIPVPECIVVGKKEKKNPCSCGVQCNISLRGYWEIK